MLTEVRATTEKNVNVAPMSTRGHHIKSDKKTTVLKYDAVEEMFVVKGDDVVIESENHFTMPVKNDSITFPQQTVDPLSGAIRRAAD